MELNPQHPVTQQMHDNWHKVVAVLMVKFGVTDVEITEEDIEKLSSSPNNCVGADARFGKLYIRLTTMEKAMELMRGGN